METILLKHGSAVIVAVAMLCGLSVALIVWLISRALSAVPRDNRQYTDAPPLGFRLKFIGTSGHKGDGDWKSLRCAESLGDNTVKAGTQGAGIGGLEFIPLKLN